MPEGDTIFRAARALHRALAGRVVTGFDSVYPALTRIDEDAPLEGRVVDQVTALGKHLLITFSGSLVLRTHMRMSGSWHLYRPNEPWQRPRRDLRIKIDTQAFIAVAFNVHDAEFLDPPAIERHRLLSAIGPDLLATDFDAGEALRRLRQRGGPPISEALLDQRVAAGIGNVYKSEVLFLERIHPETAASQLSDARVLGLFRTARTLLLRNVAEGSELVTTTRAGLRRTTRLGDPGERLWVYGRAGRPCRQCGTAIASSKSGLDARITFWCPMCQIAA